MEIDATVDDLLRLHVSRSPDAVALSCDGEEVTYGQLHRRADAVAEALVERGIGLEDVVGVLGDRNPGLVCALLGILRAGAAYLPLDPRAPMERHLSMLRQSGARLLLVDPRFLPSVRGIGLALQVLDEAEGGRTGLIQRGDESLAYVIFTSGSTGVPKGAMLEQRGLVNHLRAMVEPLRLTAKDVLAQTASASFDLSIWQMLGALVVGGRTAIIPDAVAQQPSALLRALEAEGVTVAELVPSMLQAVCIAAARKGDQRPGLSALRWMISTGEPLTTALCEQWFTLYPSVPIANAYGPTECSDDVALHLLTRPPPDATVPIGRPIANVTVHILDAALCPVAEGEVGELFVGGAGVGRGYVGDAFRTAQTFLADPFSQRPGARLYRTGDRVRQRADGTLAFLGRTDQQIKLRGQRVELGEVETAVASHPAVREAVVALIDSGSGADPFLAAYVTIDRATSEADLLLHARARLPPYMVPSAVVVLERLPVTASGKIDRKRLPHPDAVSREEGEQLSSNG